MSDDLISRQAAIDEIKALYEWHDIVTEDRAIDHFKRLPSALPEIIRCKDCKYRDYDDFCTGRGCPNVLTPDDGFCDKGERRESDE